MEGDVLRKESAAGGYFFLGGALGIKQMHAGIMTLRRGSVFEAEALALPDSQ